MIEAARILANFLAPEEIGTTPESLLLLLPIVAAIAIVYKATKLRRMSAWKFVKESAVLFLSIMAFMIVMAVVLVAVAWLVTE